MKNSFIGAYSYMAIIENFNRNLFKARIGFEIEKNHLKNYKYGSMINNDRLSSFVIVYSIQSQSYEHDF